MEAVEYEEKIYTLTICHFYHSAFSESHIRYCIATPSVVTGSMDEAALQEQQGVAGKPAKEEGNKVEFPGLPCLLVGPGGGFSTEEMVESETTPLASVLKLN